MQQQYITTKQLHVKTRAASQWHNKNTTRKNYDKTLLSNNNKTATIYMQMSKKAITTKTKIRNNTIKQQKGNMTENSDKTPLQNKNDNDNTTPLSTCSSTIIE